MGQKRGNDKSQLTKEENDAFDNTETETKYGIMKADNKTIRKRRIINVSGRGKWASKMTTTASTVPKPTNPSAKATTNPFGGFRFGVDGISSEGTDTSSFIQMNSKRQRMPELENEHRSTESQFYHHQDQSKLMDYGADLLDKKNLCIHSEKIPSPSTDVNIIEPSTFCQDKNGSTVLRQQEDPSESNDNPKKSGTDEYDSKSVLIEQIRQDLKVSTNAAAEKLDLILQDVKRTTQKLLQEMDIYLKSVEGVTIDFYKCQESQYQNAKRLEDMEGDVVSACTGGFTNIVMASNSGSNSKK